MNIKHVLAIIPARGGSKGIPRKNILPLYGKPLLAHMVETAKNTTAITRLVVSTDDAEIAMIAQQYGAEVVERPAAISGDNATSEAALLHVLEHLAATEEYRPDLLVFLQCTAPLTTTDDIEQTIQKLIDTEADTALAAVPFHYFLWQTESDGTTIGINHNKNTRLLRQEQLPQHLEAGSVYVMRAEPFREIRHRFFGKTVLHIIPEEHYHEIDTPVDFVVAEALMREQKKTTLLQHLPSPIAAVVFDFDGVFTNNQVLVSQDNIEAVLCNRSDGMGIARLRETGIPMVVITSEKNPVAKHRCDKLQLECLYGIDDKLHVLKTWLLQRGLNIAHTVYVGNDLNDCACLEAVGCGVVVQDAYPEAKAVAQIVLRSVGGNGAVREIADMIIVHIQE